MPRMPQGTGEKPRDFSGSIKKIVKYTKNYLPILFFSCALIIFSTICRLVGPNRLGAISDLINPMSNASFEMGDVVSIAIKLIILYVFAFISTYKAHICLLVH